MNEVSVIKEGWLHKRGKGLRLLTGLHVSPFCPSSPGSYALRGRSTGSLPPEEPAFRALPASPCQWLLSSPCLGLLKVVWTEELWLRLGLSLQALLTPCMNPHARPQTLPLHGPTAWPSPPKRTPRDPRAPTHIQKLAPALLPSLSWATLTWNPPLGQLAWPETSRPLVLKSSDCPCLTSTPETYPQAGLASPSAVQGEQQQRRWGKGDRHIAPRGRGACTGHTGRGPAPVPRPPTVAGAGGRASRAARGHAILSVGSWRPSWPSPRSPGFTAAPGCLHS